MTMKTLLDEGTLALDDATRVACQDRADESWDDGEVAAHLEALATSGIADQAEVEWLVELGIMED